MYKGERFNSITHLIGAVMALAGTIVLVVLVSMRGDVWQIVSFSIYGASLFLLYLMSTLYHSFKGRVKDVFRLLDHSSIYLLIAGTYTPFTLVCMRGVWGYSIFGVAWGLALIGIIQDFIFRKNRKKWLPIILYIGMGWLIVVALKPLMQVLPLSGFSLLLIGGLFYTFGVFFYVFDEKISYFHGIWHLFVLAGSIFHYITIIAYLL